MDRRNPLAGLTVLVIAVFALAGTAAAHGTVAPQSLKGTGTCTIKSLPSFIAQGEFEQAATVGDVIEVSCDPYTYSSGALVTVTASQLYSRCKEDISWYDPAQGGFPKFGRSVTLSLDVNGNANVALIAGPHCMVGESLITLDENESPYETFTTSFQVLPSANTPQGLYLTPASQVEDQETSSVVTIAQAEFSGASEMHVRLGAKQLRDRCQRGPGLVIVRSDRRSTNEQEEQGLNGGGGELLNAIELDNNGNGFAILMGIDSCAEGRSLIEADLEESPFTTETATFTVEAPRVR